MTGICCLLFTVCVFVDFCQFFGKNLFEPDKYQCRKQQQCSVDHRGYRDNQTLLLLVRRSKQLSVMPHFLLNSTNCNSQRIWKLAGEVDNINHSVWACVRI